MLNESPASNLFKPKDIASSLRRAGNHSVQVIDIEQDWANSSVRRGISTFFVLHKTSGLYVVSKMVFTIASGWVLDYIETLGQSRSFTERSFSSQSAAQQYLDRVSRNLS